MDGVSNEAAKVQKKPRLVASATNRGRFLCHVEMLFLFHHGFDFLGLYGVDVAVGIAEAEGTVVAAAHGEQALHREVEATHQFLGEGRNFILLGIHSYCCHIV